MKAQLSRRRLQAKDIRLITVILLTVGNILAGLAGAWVILYCTAYGVLRFAAGSVLAMAWIPALAAALYFTLLYGINCGILRRIRSLQGKHLRWARCATAAAFFVAFAVVLGVLIHAVVSG